ncbi:hypothetical protein VCR4J5_1510009 [Vibrio crassostreae]|uniref:Uncharacterized protein n=1 Tax=Vibrio crassostreae TaxID=246167 RepID=A0ABM9QPD0_9VIBR|nr:hypothetical protein VCR19J5_1210349 [Vibrio crassostreae]CDT10832.1 hypothetical protein VCR4J5_1510009 [Vibrio crassostreae]CDT51950.1 hypothetical protein VCR9J2_720324 [Vibrio crassostreae]
MPENGALLFNRVNREAFESNCGDFFVTVLPVYGLDERRWWRVRVTIKVQMFKLSDDRLNRYIFMPNALPNLVVFRQYNSLSFDDLLSIYECRGNHVG